MIHSAPKTVKAHRSGYALKNNRYYDLLPDGRLDLACPLDQDINNGRSVNDFRIEVRGYPCKKMLPTLFKLLTENVKDIVIFDAALNFLLIVHGHVGENGSGQPFCLIRIIYHVHG